MQVIETEIPDVKIFVPARHGDARGYFSEVWSRKAFADAGLDADFVQDNVSRNPVAGTLRGLHYQFPPAAQGKLVRVARGAVLDVAVDVRRNSPTFGRHVAIEISEENWYQLWIPRGFAHGYCTLTPDTDFLYKVDAPYTPSAERGIRWDDPALAIAWPFSASEVRVNDRDRNLPVLAEQPDLPVFEAGP